MPFRQTFSCLWCGRSHTVRSEADLEGWAQLCPECVGRAGDNGFLRFRLKTALAERAKASNPKASNPRAAAEGSAAAAVAPAPAAAVAPAADGAPSPAPAVAAPSPAAPAPSSAATTIAAAARAEPPAHELHDEMLAYYEARAPEYDDFYLRRGRYSRGAIHDMAWMVDLDTATRWLDQQPIRGDIVELAAGTGWWSPLLAQKGELSAYDAAEAPLDRARDRLLAHNLRAHLHVRDAWAEPEREVDAVFAGFWLSHVPRAELDAFLALVRRWLKPGGTFLVIDSLADPQSGAVDHDVPDAAGGQLRRLNDGREFRVVKVHYDPRDLERALERAGFRDAEVRTTSRFFLLGRAVAG